MVIALTLGGRRRISETEYWAAEQQRHSSMILCDTSLIDGYTKEGVWGQATLDALFRKNVRTHRDQVALVDPPNREDFTCGAARQLTYGEADEIIDDLTVMFRSLRIERDDVIAVQLPNTVELPLLILACFRAGIIISVLPPLWNEHELENALNRISPKVLISQPVQGHTDTLTVMRDIAAKVYSVRHVLAVGDDVPDGIVPLDEAVSFARENVDIDDGNTNSADKTTSNDVAILSWNGVESPDLMAMPRSHNHLITAGLSVLLEASLEDQSVILCPLGLSGLAAWGSFFVPWILTGGSFHLHQPFDWSTFKNQLQKQQPTFTGLPPAALTVLSENVNNGELDLSCLKALACLWPTLGSTLPASNIDTYLLPTIVDIFSIGELAIFPHRRTEVPTLNLIPHGECKFPSSSANGPSLITTRIKGCAMKNGSTGTMLVGQLMVKGPMIYEGTYQPGAKNPAEFRSLERDDQAFVATGIKCEIVDVEGPKLKPVDRLNEVIYHGGLAVAAQTLDTVYSEFPAFERAVAVSITDPILGERIAAVVVPGETGEFSFDDFKEFLEDRKLAPYKIPDRLIKVKDIPVDEDSHVVRRNPETLV